MEDDTSGALSPVRRAARFLNARLDTTTFLGLHLTLSLIVALAAIWFFGAVLDAVLDNATMVRWDLWAAAAIHARVTPAGLTAFDWISRAGSPVAMGVVGVVGIVTLRVERRILMVVMWIGAFCGSVIVEGILKLAVHRTRPVYGAAYLTDTSFSFPSGHSMGVVVGMGMILYTLMVFGELRGTLRVVAIVVACVFVLAVGMSRIYLGVHYPSDVLGGYAAGAAWLAVCIGVTGIVLHRRGRSLSS